MAEDSEQAPPPDDTQRWEQSETGFWKRQQLRHALWKNLAWLAAGILLAVLLNQLGCSGFTFG